MYRADLPNRGRGIATNTWACAVSESETRRRGDIAPCLTRMAARQKVFNFFKHVPDVSASKTAVSHPPTPLERPAPSLPAQRVDTCVLR